MPSSHTHSSRNCPYVPYNLSCPVLSYPILYPLLLIFFFSTWSRLIPTPTCGILFHIIFLCSSIVKSAFGCALPLILSYSSCIYNSLVLTSLLMTLTCFSLPPSLPPLLSPFPTSFLPSILHSFFPFFFTYCDSPLLPSALFLFFYSSFLLHHLLSILNYPTLHKKYVILILCYCTSNSSLHRRSFTVLWITVYWLITRCLWIRQSVKCSALPL